MIGGSGSKNKVSGRGRKVEISAAPREEMHGWDVKIGRGERAAGAGEWVEL